MLRQHSFGHEIPSLKSNTTIHRSSSLFKLDPFLDTNGVLRVAGRLKRSMLDINEVHPVILPKANLITETIVTWCHENVAHSGRSMTLNNLGKSSLWLISANSVVQRTIFRCVTCRKLHGVFGYQKMTDLPKDRCIEAPPFTHYGGNMFEPFVIRERRSDLKRYCALFTCFANRTVDTKVANAMDTDSFIQALRRSIARRGAVQSIRSDNGTNFVGASNELKKTLDKLDQEQIRQHLLKSGTDLVKWQKNPPGASLIGRIWERNTFTSKQSLKHC